MSKKNNLQPQPRDRRLNHGRVEPNPNINDLTYLIDGIKRAAKDQDLLVTHASLAILYAMYLTRTGEGTLTKGSHSLPFSSSFAAGDTYHIEFYAVNGIGNVGATILSTDKLITGFTVKVDLDCTYTYKATKIL